MGTTGNLESIRIGSDEKRSGGQAHNKKRKDIARRVPE